MAACRHPRGTVTSARFLPLTWTGRVMLSSSSRAAVGHRPGGLADEARLAERRPALLGQMRHHRRDELHQDVAGLAQGAGEVGGQVSGRRLAPSAAPSALASS